MTTNNNADSEEENLSWLQEFHVNTIGPSTKNDIYIDDDSIGRYLGYNSNPPPSNLANIKFRIYCACNPAWLLRFYDDTGQILNIAFHQLPIDIEEKTNRIIENYYPEEVEIESLFINFKDDCYYNFSSPLYLNLAVEFFKSCINKSELPIINTLALMRNQFKQNNRLSTWLEEFYFSCCDGDWERNPGGGIGLIAVRNGWIFSFPVIDFVYNDKNFNNIIIKQEEGNIECYKHKGIFIARTHSRGLITGLRIFKEWIES